MAKSNKAQQNGSKLVRRYIKAGGTWTPEEIQNPALLARFIAASKDLSDEEFENLVNDTGGAHGPGNSESEGMQRGYQGARSLLETLRCLAGAEEVRTWQGLHGS